MAKRVELTGEHGLRGAVAEPAGSGKVGGVVVVQEWFGITAHIEALVDRFAGAGFLAVAPDLYHGKVATSEDEAAKAMNALDFGKAVTEIGAAAHYVKGQARSNGKVAVVGFCLGGALTIAAAANVPGLAAAVPFYGVPDVDKLDLSKVHAPILAHFAERDEWAAPGKAEALKKKLEAHGRSMELHVYPAGHAFMRDTDPSRHDPKSAKLAWERTIEFLKTHLG